jgi:hypothetical protein
MAYFIFSFSYLSKEKLSLLKKAFINDSNYSLSFLTRNNFNFYFNKKYNNIKHILYGKYIVISNSNVSNYDSFITELIKIKEIINSLEINLNVFLMIFNSSLYFDDFLNESNKYNSSTIFNLIKFNNTLNNYNILLNNFMVYNKIFLSINNSIKNNNSSNNLISYMY